MRKIALELALFGIVPFLVAVVCLFGLVGGITETEAFVPIYLIGLIFGTTAVGLFAFSVLFKAIRWFVTNGS